MYSEIFFEVLEKETDWLEQVINQSIKSYLMHEGHEQHWLDIIPPDFNNNDSPYAITLKETQSNIFDRLALALTIAPHIRPELLDIFFGKNQLYDRGFTEFGGSTDKTHTGFLPTGQTFMFIAASALPELRKDVFNVLSNENSLIKEGILILEETENNIPGLNGILSLNKNWLMYFMTGEKLVQEYNSNFPAKKISTDMNWDDVVLDEQVMEQVTEIIAWINHGEILMGEWGLSKKIKPGYRALFYGLPGTGKTLTATLIGKVTGIDVYRVDLSMIVSKYIGETEKNLSKLFDVAQHSNWILFFDEADALFGKRTAANSSNDRHANQQTAYLLQRIEDFPGIIILASNLKANMDEAFTRRFQAMVQFTMPSVEERFQLWQKAFSGTCTLDSQIDLNKIAEDYAIAGGSIINVLRYCALSAITRNDTVVSKEELLNGIRREFKKENKTLHITK